MFRLLLVCFCLLITLSSCGCGRSLNIAPTEETGRCRALIGDDWADFMIVGEAASYDIFDTTDTGERLAVRIDSVTSSDPAIVEVTMLEDALGDDVARVQISANAVGHAILHIESDDGEDSDQVISVVASESDLPSGKNAACP